MSFLWRTVIPSWQFFKEVGPSTQIHVKWGQNDWQPLYKPLKRSFISLFLNAQGNNRLAVNSLIERLVVELKAAQKPSELVSYQLLKQIVGSHCPADQASYQFKIADYLISPIYEVNRP